MASLADAASAWTLLVIAGVLEISEKDALQIHLQKIGRLELNFKQSW